MSACSQPRSTARVSADSVDADSGSARKDPSMVCGADTGPVYPSAELVVHPAPAPGFPGLGTDDHRMADRPEVRAGVLARRGVATGDVVAGQAEAQVHPRRPLHQAVLAGRRGGRTALGAIRRCAHRVSRGRGTRARSRSRDCSSSLRSSSDSSMSTAARAADSTSPGALPSSRALTMTSRSAASISIRSRA